MQTYKAKALNGHFIVFVEHTCYYYFAKIQIKSKSLEKTYIQCALYYGTGLYKKLSYR